jgi:hypothetical protein
MLKTFVAIICVATLVMLAIALAPNVPTALATAPSPAVHDAAKLNQPEDSCAAFEVWFLNRACSKAHIKKASHPRHRVAHNGLW